MSGGQFDYKQYQINDIADELERLISRCKERNPNDWLGDLSEETLKEFEQGLNYLRLAAVYVQRIDWLVSGDDGEDSFHSRLEEEVLELMN